MKWKNYIETDPNILFGKPVIKGTRISVELVLEKLGNGMSEDDLLEAYPHLSKEQVQACIAYASDQLKSEIAYSDG
ncbi:MAG TPA: antitoxin [Balneolaceae bacterium]|nr:antitoxin [Balneola sp.]HBQ59905.1 antitoxin [Balneolaceae bacterium]|tara:strand:+ start:1387 stop:1614 length:228 start_codon:yes stop_codon:yes gene_type:complete